jgi:hypothetical protein
MNEHFFIYFLFVIFKQIHHIFIIELKKGAVDFDKLSTFSDDAIENMVNSSWDNTSMILILF